MKKSLLVLATILVSLAGCQNGQPGFENTQTTSGHNNVPASSTVSAALTTPAKVVVDGMIPLNRGTVQYNNSSYPIREKIEKVFSDSSGEFDFLITAIASSYDFGEDISIQRRKSYSIVWAYTTDFRTRIVQASDKFVTLAEYQKAGRIALVTLDANTGATLWRVESILAEADPFLTNGLIAVYAVNPERLDMFELATGKLVRSEPLAALSNDPRMRPAANLTMSDGALVTVREQAKKQESIECHSQAGQLLWVYSVTNTDDYNGSRILELRPGVLLVVRGSLRGSTQDDSLLLDAKTGKVLGTLPSTRFELVRGDKLYLYSNLSGKLTAMDSTTLQKLWELPFSYDLDAGSFVLQGNYLITNAKSLNGKTNTGLAMLDASSGQLLQTIGNPLNMTNPGARMQAIDDTHFMSEKIDGEGSYQIIWAIK